VKQGTMAGGSVGKELAEGLEIGAYAGYSGGVR
jgi:hypothetical protein